jgi:hypothetical protein
MDDKELKDIKCGVIYSGMLFIPSIMKISRLIQQLLWGQTQERKLFSCQIKVTGYITCASA